MVYLEYELQSKQVVEIHEVKPEAKDKYGVAKSDIFNIGDEFESTIWVNETILDEEAELFVVSYSAIKNNPYVSRILKENKELSTRTQDIELALADIFSI